MHLRNPIRIVSRSPLRTRIEQARHLGWIEIVQVAECPAAPDHSVRSELVCKAYISGVIELTSNRRNDRLVRLLNPPGYRSRCPQRRLIEDAGAFLQSIACAEGHVGAQAVLQIDRCVLVRLVPRTDMLVKRESRSITEGRV